MQRTKISIKDIRIFCRALKVLKVNNLTLDKNVYCRLFLDIKDKMSYATNIDDNHIPKEFIYYGITFKVDLGRNA